VPIMSYRSSGQHPNTPSGSPGLEPQAKQVEARSNRGGGGGCCSKRDNGADGYQHKWATGMCLAPCANPTMCLMGCFCPWCCAFKQRKKLLQGRMDQYTCCAGIWGPCTDKTESCTKPCPSVCLCLEVLLCLGCAVHGNRYMVQQRYQLENECMDVALMYLSCICSCLACITGEDSLELLADCIYYATVGCMIAQNDYEMSEHNFPYDDRKPVQQEML